MNRVLKVALICGVAATMASCGTVRRNLPFGLGGKEDAKATASAGDRISVLEFDQQLAPSAALSGRDFFLPGPQAVTAWTQPGGTAENLVEHVIAAPEFQIAWKRGVGSGSARVGNVMAPIVAADGKVFVLDGESTVSAVSADTGAVLWKVNVKNADRDRNGGFGGGVAVGAGKVFVSSGYRSMSALDANTGAVIWTQQVDAPIHGAPTVSGNRVFVVSKSGQLITVNRDTGQIYWTRELNEGRIRKEGGVFGFFDRELTPQWSGPLLASNRLVMVNSFGEAVAFDPKTGAAQTTLKLGAPAYIAPAAYNGALYVLTDNGQLICIR